MPEYIFAGKRGKPTCRRADCDPAEQPEHWVSIKIGPAILGPLEKLLTYLKETHEGAMQSEANNGMMAHRREEPGCSYCAAIREGKAVFKAIDGKEL